MDGLITAEERLRALGFADAADVAVRYGPALVAAVVSEVLADPTVRNPGGVVRWRLRRRAG